VASHAAKVVHAVSERSFNDLIAPLVQPAYRLACAMLHDATTAEDVVQDASVIAWRKFDRLESTSRLRTWFLGIVANECRNSRRRGWTARVRIGIPRSLSVASSEDEAVRRADLRKALLELPNDDRLVIVLYFYLDLAIPDVAAVAGASVEATRARLYRAIRRLRPGLVPEEALE
jgi:RNA polymerase sigma-70 factor (ECF subfamily)